MATGQGIFTTVTRTPAGASSATGSAVPLSTDAPVADPSSVASLDGNGSHSPALSKAAIGGIAAAAAVAVLAGLGVYVFLRRRKARRAQLGPSPDEDAGMDFSDTPMGMEGAGAAAMAPSPWTYTGQSFQHTTRVPTETIELTGRSSYLPALLTKQSRLSRSLNGPAPAQGHT